MEKKQTGMWKQLVILLFSVLVLVAFDQWTKHLAVLYLKDQDPIVLIKGVFELKYLQNRGAAFGMFKDQRIVFLVMTTIIMAALLYVYCRLPKGRRYLPMRVLCIVILSGAVGNMIDRCLQGYVVDFLYFSLIDFPIFNVADIYVTVSAFVFLAFYIFYYKEEEFEFLSWKKSGVDSVREKLKEDAETAEETKQE